MATVSKITRCSAPYYVQFEVTRRCNNRCFFCYNEIGNVEGAELSTAEIKRVISEMCDAGVFKINFNGGEPLTRKDFFEFAEFAHDKGFQLHMNTNATLVTPEVATRISRLMPSVCVSLLSSIPEEHDLMSGRKGAFKEVLRGMDYLRDNGVSIEVNVCTTKKNFKRLPDIAQIAAQHGCSTLCSTRYILSSPDNIDLLLGPQETVALIHELLAIQESVPGIKATALPGPVPFCEVPKEEWENLKKLNIPCQFGYGLCRISPVGIITPCPISDDAIADLRKVSFASAWQSDGWRRYERICHIQAPCRSCEVFPECKCGCIVYDECLKSAGVKPCTKKWSANG